jgi:aspartyl-tRNA(Asn)/glutamyl-tRNA(Gln) amidotransferase subunit B
MPELPNARRQRFINEYQLSDYDAKILADDAGTAHFFEDCTKICKDPKLTANWVMGELAARLNAEDLSIAKSPVSPEQIAGVIERIKDNSISNKIAKQVFDALWKQEGKTADEIIEAKGLKQVSDTGALEAMIDEVINNSTQQVDNYRKADPDKRPKMLGYFVGQIMKASKGQANPQMVNQLLNEKLNKLID